MAGTDHDEGTTMTATTAPLTLEAFFGAMVSLTDAITRQTAIQERLAAGADKALALAEAGKPATTRTPRAKKEEPAAAAPATETGLNLPAVAVGDGEALKAIIQPWLAEAKKGTPEATERTGFFKDMAGHFSIEPKFANFAADADTLKQTLFFFERKKAGHTVTFGAEYDFDGALDQDEPAAPAAAADEDDFG
jgi:hypothetical protein